jgi:hypothetical protein
MWEVGVAVGLLVLMTLSGGGQVPGGEGGERDGLTAARIGSIARIQEGMLPSEVVAILGRPSRKQVSLAEGYAWPEPKVVCWYYPSPEPTRADQVCFIRGEVRTAASFAVGGG